MLVLAMHSALAVSYFNRLCRANSVGPANPAAVATAAAKKTIASDRTLTKSAGHNECETEQKLNEHPKTELQQTTYSQANS
ncbi:MAG: hypothetical protein PF630_02320 [Gammaproteobacteria bacterium]|jgi:hypothetical protein|nr:hypothetical protein [Gammaproteobacteria bacterium]